MIPILLLTNLFSACALSRENDQFFLGEHYIEIADYIGNKVDTMHEKDTTEVLMFFSYGCYWCKHFHKPFNVWSQQHKDIVVDSYPVSFNDAWSLLAKLYYVIENFNDKVSLHDAIFHSIHHARQYVWQPMHMEFFFMQQGIHSEAYMLAFSSFYVKRQVQLAHNLAEIYQINIVPACIVRKENSSYLTNIQMTGDVSVLLNVVDYLVSL